MKRTRGAPGVFGGGGSDTSSSSGAPRASRPRLSLSDDDVEDSLDKYMSSLRPVASRGACAAPLDDDEEEDAAAWVGARAAVEAEDSASEEEERVGPARDLSLESVDHSRLTYAPIVKGAYVPLPRFAALDDAGVRAKCASVGAVVSGARVVPVDGFQDFALALPKALLGATLRLYEVPTPVQRIAIPAALAGENVVAVAKTGSGKTAAYAVPMISHVASQGGSSVGGRGPVALVVAPTRELTTQIASVVRGFARAVGVGVACVVGGHAKFEQFKMLRDSRAGIVVCTPGRFIDMIKMKACGLARCSFVVLDEADRMFDMGFGHQVDALLSQIRPDAQMLLFSATFPTRIEQLATTYMSNHVKILVGRGGDKGVDAAGRNAVGRGKELSVAAQTMPMVSENVKESYVLLNHEAERMTWLTEQLPNMLETGLVIVFCQTRGGSAALANKIRATGVAAACVHGETDHADREGLLRMFRSGEIRLLVTTDLAARGLDIADVRNVVNFESAKSWDWHVHRVGRTGRAAQKGNAFTLLCRSSKSDASFVAQAVSAFRRAQLPVPATLQEFGGSSGGFGGPFPSRGGSGGGWRRRGHH